MTARDIITRILAGIAVILIGIGINYVFLPAWNFQSGGMFGYIIIIAVIAAVAFFLAEAFEGVPFLTIISTAIAILFFVVWIIACITSSRLFNATKYQSLIKIEDGSFENDVVANNIQDIAVVDINTAKKLGDRTMAALQNPSWYELDNEYNLIIYQGKQYRISCINYGGFFEYNKAKSHGIPGYVLVNAITQEAQLVTLDSAIQYSPSAFFDKDLTRHLRDQYPSYIFGKSFFEIDEDGNPYWITSVKKSTIGLFGGKKEESFIITDACTGKSAEYLTDELPEWIDHAFDLNYLMDMVYCNYEYINGFFNFSKTGVNRTAYFYRDSEFPGYNTTISSDGIVFYTSVTPANTAESILGFIFANPRTGVVKFYSCSGAEESSAQAAAEGLVQNLGYDATFPTIINVDGNPTYFMVLKDGAGLIQRYALCNVSNYTQVFQASTLEETLKGFRLLIGTDDELQEEKELITTTGVIEFIDTAELDGYTYFYFTFTGNDNLYMSSIQNSNRQVLLTVGSIVTIEYMEYSEKGVYIVKTINF